MSPIRWFKSFIAKNRPQKKVMKKTCPRCGKHFECVVGDNCWCDKITVSKENLMKIRREYMDCLCSDCLKSYSEEAAQ